MSNGDIIDGSIQASSAKTLNGKTYHGYYGRLHSDEYWWAESNEVAPWVRVDIGYSTNISGVVTQGDGGWGRWEDWVTHLKVSTFVQSTGDDENFVKNEDGTEMVSTQL